MNTKKYKLLLRLTALVLAMVLLVPAGANAATAEPVQPCASEYLHIYQAYLSAMSGGKIRIHFTLEGFTTLDSIGATEIFLYQSFDNVNWTFVTHYDCHDYSRMMAYDTIYHSSYMEYQGVVGRYYKAMVYLYGGKDGDGDMYFYQTDSVRAIS